MCLTVDQASKKPGEAALNLTSRPSASPRLKYLDSAACSVLALTRGSIAPAVQLLPDRLRPARFAVGEADIETGADYGIRWSRS
jgi:hypothetical protein